MLYNKLDIGDYVFDPDMNEHGEYGIVREIHDIHNVFVEYENEGGSGLYCLDPACEDFDPSLKLIKK